MPSVYFYRRRFIIFSREVRFVVLEMHSFTDPDTARIGQLHLALTFFFINSPTLIVSFFLRNLRSCNFIYFNFDIRLKLILLKKAYRENISYAPYTGHVVIEWEELSIICLISRRERSRASGGKRLLMTLDVR